MRYIDADKLYEYLEQVSGLYPRYADNIVDNAVGNVIGGIKTFITSLQQEQPKGNLEYWLEHFGMPKENIDNCITQIAQGYGACRYLEGIQHGVEAVNELAKQEQPKCSSSLVDVDVVREDFIREVYRVLDADSTNDRANAIIDAFDSLPTIQQSEVEFEKELNDYLYPIQSWQVEDEPFTQLTKCARHFYKLGRTGKED